MKNRLKIVLAAAVFALTAGALGTANADPISCGTPCFGMTFTLTYTEITPTQFSIDYTLNTTGSTLPATDWVQAVSFKPASSILATSAFVSTSAPGIWSGQLGGLNSGGCDGSGSGYICASDGTSALLDGSTYDWIFTINVANASDWLLTAGAASIKANFNGPGQCANGCLVSQDITLQQSSSGSSSGSSGTISEPNSSVLSLMGVGILLAAMWMRRRSLRA